ncbi:unnamed protein product [Mytilus coruscus]|uniref:Uncharacterized protein n=1 Tax=Mytilus coruscus TaxID=42192 RepID=A0A6J8CGP8_MYTCO|nr:unnamed protein product [Mytilus coruscus]
MGNKHTTSKKDVEFPGEIRGRSRSFTGFSSKFRRKSKSPTRERSSSVSEQRPKRGSLKSSQNSDTYSGQNGHSKLSKTNSLPMDGTSKPVTLNWNKKSAKEDKNDSSNSISTSAPSRSRYMPHHHNSSTITFLEGKDTLGRDTIRKSFTQQEMEESPNSTAKRMRQLTNVIYGDKLANLSLRRGLAIQNRDMSLSQASLSKISMKSRSLHSLLSTDYENDEFEDNICVCSDEKSPKQQDFSQSKDFYFMRPRTGSAPASEFTQKGKMAMGAGDHQRRKISHQMPLESTPKEVVRNAGSYEKVNRRSPEEVIQARRMLVFRALKTEDGVVSPDDSKIQNKIANNGGHVSPMKNLRNVGVGQQSPTKEWVNSAEYFKQDSHNHAMHGNRLESPNSFVCSNSSDSGSAPSNDLIYYAASQSENYKPNSGSKLVAGRSSDALFDNRSVSPGNRSRSPVKRSSSPINNEQRAIYSQIVCTQNLKKSPVKEDQNPRTLEKNRNPKTPTKNVLPNIDEYKVLSSNVSKGDRWGSYETLTRKAKNNDEFIDQEYYLMRDRSHSFSLSSPKPGFRKEKRIEKSFYDDVCISPIMDYEQSPRLRTRSNSWSVLHEKHNISPRSKGQQSMNRLWSYSVTSLSDMSSELSKITHNAFLMTDLMERVIWA